MKRNIYLLILASLFLFKTESNAQAPMYTVNLSGQIMGLNGASTPVSIYLDSQWMPYILWTDASGFVSVELMVDSFMLPGNVVVVFADCGMDSVGVTLPVDVNNLSPTFTAEYCASGEPFGAVTVQLPDANGEPVPVNVYSGMFGGSFMTDLSGSVSVAVPYTDPYQDVIIEHYVCQGGMWDTLIADGDLSAGITYVGDYCDSSLVTGTNVTVLIHLDNAGGANVPVVVTTDGFMYPAYTDGNGDATVNISVVNPYAPIMVDYSDCNGQYQSMSLFLAPGDSVVAYAGDYCPGGPVDSCGVLFTVSYDPADNTFYLEMDSAVQADAVEFIWDFADGTIDSVQYPTHTFAQNDLYNVCLYTATASGVFCTYCHEIGIDSLGNVVTRTDADGFTVQVVPFGTTSGPEELPEQSFELFPNPASDHTVMQLYSDTAETYAVNVYNAVGQTVKVFSVDAQHGHNQFNLPVQDLLPGYYLVSLEIGNITVSRSLVK